MVYIQNELYQVFGLMMFIIGQLMTQSEETLQLEHIVLIDQNTGLIIEKNRFYVWNMTNKQINSIEPVIGDLYFDNTDIMWVPYIKHTNSDEEHFEFDFGKVCLRKNKQNMLLTIRVDLESNIIWVNRSDLSDCNQYVLVSDDSVCTITALLPLSQQDITLVSRYASLLLVGLNRYFYVVFDKKFEYLNKHRLSVIVYNHFSTNSTMLSMPHCLIFLQKYITLRKVTAGLVTGVKEVIPLSNGNIFVIFQSHYCILNIAHFLKCDKINMSNLFDLRRSKRESLEDSNLVATGATGKCWFGKEERETRPTSVNEYRAIFLILTVFLVCSGIITLHRLTFRLTNSNLHTF